MRKRFFKPFYIGITCLLLLSVSLTGCTAQQDSQQANPSGQNMDTQHGGDTLETTAGPQRLPSFLKSVDPQIATVYQTAAANPGILKNMPCYCGCGESVGHKNNLDCFVHEIKPDGKIVWDSHGITCGTCQNIAMEAIMLRKEGHSLLDIRKQVDTEYKEGYAKPTPTPMPAL
ncbi:PCYCGC motif-containing (lipo)protein [Aneurinibacillus terranovensis]|uniref:PCYCGC motif-containing (lipo)protein n=1 Tax=Aneurinibacillus terranovensis TaxID=278991 RepID=UPI0003FF8EDA|nr:PCYCGC motif-containing (lipo)protein [Aneurinibacillus terranovensis]